MYLKTSSDSLLAGKANTDHSHPLSQITGFPTPLTAGDLLVASDAATLSRTPIGAAGQVLTAQNGAPVWATWSTGLPAAGASSATLRDNGSAWVAATNFANDGTNLNSTGTYKSVSPATQIAFWGQHDAGPRSIVGTATPTPASASVLGCYDFCGAGVTGARMMAIAMENWGSAGNPCGTTLYLQTVAAGATNLVNRLIVSHAGSIVTNGSLVPLATTAGSGFCYLPTMPGQPTGSPWVFSGNAAVAYDTSNHEFWVRDTISTVGWFGMGPGRKSVSKTGGFTLSATDEVVWWNTQSGGFICFLPAANAVPAGKPYTVFWIGGEASERATIARSGTDTINNGLASLAAAAATAFLRFDLISDGVSRWAVHRISP